MRSAAASRSSGTRSLAASTQSTSDAFAAEPGGRRRETKGLMAQFVGRNQEGMHSQERTWRRAFARVILT